MKLVLFATCLWHTTLMHRGLPDQEVQLVQEPKIGAKIHINGTVWKVSATKRLCGTQALRSREMEKK